MLRLLTTIILSFISIVPYVIFFIRVLNVENDTAWWLSVFFGWIVTPFIILRYWRTAAYDTEAHDVMDELILDDQEESLWHQGQGTFHRGYDFQLVITNKNIYLFDSKIVFLRKWYKFPLASIENITLKDSFSGVFKLFRKKTPFPRTLLTIKYHQKIFNHISYPDSYEDERIFDRQILLNFIDQLKALNIEITNNTTLNDRLKTNNSDIIN